MESAPESTRIVSEERLAELMAVEERRFVQDHGGSAELFERAKGSLLGGVPMPWMTEWAGPFPVFVESARDGEFTDVDGREYVDLCFGDTGSMTGHSPPPVAEAIARQAANGITLMLPTADSTWVAEELGRRFGLPYWQFALTATDANRFTIRTAREITGRSKILVFSWCYHGSVDETLIVLEDGKPRARPGNVGPAVDPTTTTRVVEWNDVEALERELAHGDVACVLAEPALTNIGIVPADEGFHDALRELTRRHGTLLVIDETHTFCTGPGGYTAAHGLEPDFVTIGKSIASGLPAAAYGMSREVAERVERDVPLETSDVGGIGGTLSGNALSLAAIRATLAEVLTDEAFERMIALARRYEEGIAAVIAENRLPWHVTRLGCRVEYWFRDETPRNGGEAAAAVDPPLDRYLHLYALNRGVLMTPFHNMALMSPATRPEHVERYLEIFREAVAELLSA
jgi:glutamate-1-semialdehyde 2,1-aminomutase